MSKYEIESLIETMNNYDDLASKAKAKADAIRDTLKGECSASARKTDRRRLYPSLYERCLQSF